MCSASTSAKIISEIFHYSKSAEEMLQKGSKADCIEAAVWCVLRISIILCHSWYLTSGFVHWLCSFFLTQTLSTVVFARHVLTVNHFFFKGWLKKLAESWAHSHHWPHVFDSSINSINTSFSRGKVLLELFCGAATIVAAAEAAGDLILF